MARLCAQGDILIERVDDAAVSRQVIGVVDEGAAIRKLASTSPAIQHRVGEDKFGASGRTL
jgi:hypothetical protein